MIHDIFFFIREEPYGFLSNFWRAIQVVDGIAYDSNERYYQVQKAKDPAVKAWIYNAPTPYLAMVVGHNLRSGKEVSLEHTDEKRVETMLKGLRAKFTQNPDLAKQLIATGDATLHENNPTDFFWGYAEGKGNDLLGKCLMIIRQELVETLVNKASSDHP
jgi:GTP cyclohydrolase II